MKSGPILTIICVLLSQEAFANCEAALARWASQGAGFENQLLTAQLSPRRLREKSFTKLLLLETDSKSENLFEYLEPISTDPNLSAYLLKGADYFSSYFAINLLGDLLNALKVIEARWDFLKEHPKSATSEEVTTLRSEIFQMVKACRVAEAFLDETTDGIYNVDKDSLPFIKQVITGFFARMAGQEIHTTHLFLSRPFVREFKLVLIHSDEPQLVAHAFSQYSLTSEN